jgi:putative membrane protein
MEEKARNLVLCIDRDDDVGKKTELDTPIVGKEANLAAASALAVADPEEADSNAMFGAVKLYRELIDQYPDEEFQVATISGSARGGIESDRKMLDELTTVLKDYPATGIILVTDGFAESLTPILESRVPINSVHHVVVKHSQRVEETYAVLFRYLRMLIDDPYYARITLGVPGILLVIFGFLIASNQLENAGLAVTFVIGAVLFLKGFGIYNKLAKIRLRRPPPEQQLVFAAWISGAVVAIIGIFQGVSYASTFLPAQLQPISDLGFWAGILPTLVAEFLLKGIDLIVIGVIVSFVGRLASHYMRREFDKLYQNVLSIIIAFWMRFIAIESAKILLEPGVTLTLWSPLIFYTLASVATTIVAVVLIYSRYKKLPFT